MLFKKRASFFAIVVFLLFIFGSSAFSQETTEQPSPYIEPEAGVSPHGGYTTTTNKCKYCHAVHRATGSYMLTRADSRPEVCDYCHGDGAGAGNLVVADYEGHSVSKDMMYLGPAPGGEDGDVFVASSTNPFLCISCHSVHGDTLLIVHLSDLPSSYLLLNNPDKMETTYTTSNTLSEWCADCHSAIFGSHEVTRTVGGEPTFSHDTSRVSVTTFTIDPRDGINSGPSCQQCHTSSMFPHGQGGTGRDMLKDSFDGISLDDVCNDCHSEASLP